MASKLHLLYASTLLIFLVTLLFFFVEIGLGVVAIVTAKNGNNCTDANAFTPCIRFETVETTPPPSEVDICTSSDNCTMDDLSNSTLFVDQRPPGDYFYWMGPATAMSVVVAMAGTIVFVLFVEMVREEAVVAAKKAATGKKALEKLRIHVKPIKPMDDGDQTDDRTSRTLSPAPTSTVDDIKFRDDVFGGGVVEQEWKVTGPLRSFDVPSAAAAFFALLSLNMAFLSLMWAIAISYEYYSYVDVWWVYFVVDALIGIILPIFVFIFATLFAVVLDFITIGRVDAREGLSFFLPSAAFVKAKNSSYWIIEGTFYFPVERHRHRLKHGCLYSFDKNPYTWCLVLLVFLSFFLAFAHLANISVIDEKIVTDCRSLITPNEYDCFSTNGTLYGYQQVRCDSNRDSSAVLYCFRFIRFGVDINAYTVFSLSFSFYLGILALFTTLFKAVKIAISIKPSRYWAIGLLMIFAIIFNAALVISFLRDIVGIHITMLSLAQVYLISFQFLLVGLLLVKGNWWELVNSPKSKPAKAKVLFVKFSNTSTAILQTVEKQAYEEEYGSSTVDGEGGEGEEAGEKNTIV